MSRRGVAVGSLTVALHQALAEVAHHIEETLAREGLSLPQWLVIGQLAESGRRTMGGLVLATGLNDSTLTRVVDRLISLGLIYREVDPTDRRRVRVSLSSRGQALYDELAPVIEERESALLTDLDHPSLVEALSRLGDPDAAWSRRTEPAVPRVSARSPGHRAADTVTTSATAEGPSTSTHEHCNPAVAAGT